MADPLSRRDLLRLGAAAAPSLLATACGWDGGPLLRPRLDAAARLNDRVGQLLFSTDRLARTYPESARSPRMPTYWTAKVMPEVADPDAWRLPVGGLVQAPLTLSLAMLQQMPSVTYTVKHHCVEGWTAIATWTGVPLATIVQAVQPLARAEYVRFDSFDAGYHNGWDLPSTMHPQTILAYAWNGQPLTPARGAPVRLYSPVKLGYKLTKYLSAITFTDQRPGGYWEDKGYPWFGGV